MESYYVNTNAQANGNHEVHRYGCSYFPNFANAELLGNYMLAILST